MSSVACDGLDKSWVGRELTLEDVDKLVKLKVVNVAGEGGEFESLVLDCPLFKEEISIVEKEILEESEHVVRMNVVKAIKKKKG